jgi:hypothetical protein
MTVPPEKVASAEAQIVEESKRIDFYTVEFSLELLAMKMERREFVIPEYQREDTWEPPRKSRFVESILMGLPVPFLFFWESPETGKLEIVDGCQRLRTIQQFILGGFVLRDLERLTELEGMGFQDLPESRQHKTKNRSIRGIVLNEHADGEARFDLFDRINTGSKIPTKAELRRGALPGPFLDLAIELATDPLFERLAPVPEADKKLREREELVTRFFAYGDGLDDYQDRVSAFLHAYARRMNDVLRAQPAGIEQYRGRFRDTMEFVGRVFPYGFRKNSGATATPRARFEAIAIGSYLALKENPALASRTPDVAWIDSEEFGNVVGSDGANVRKKLVGRLEFVRKRLLGE